MSEHELPDELRKLFYDEDGNPRSLDDFTDACERQMYWKEVWPDDGGEPVLEAFPVKPDVGHVLDWARWRHGYMQSGLHRVGEDTVNGITVSTVFLSMNHNFFMPGVPLLYETCLFWRGESREIMGLDVSPSDVVERYPNRLAARAGHERWVAECEHAPPEVPD